LGECCASIHFNMRALKKKEPARARPCCAAEVDYNHAQRTNDWLPPSVRRGLEHREATFAGSHEVVLLRRPLDASNVLLGTLVGAGTRPLLSPA
jgi:hypothetical protein